MKKDTLLALAAFITTFAENECGTCTEATASQPEETPAPPSPTPAKRRGRPPTTPEPPAAAATPEPEQPAAPAEPEAPAPTGGKTYEDLQALIRPYVVEHKKGEQVRAEIAKFAPDLKTLATMPQHHAAFEKNLQPLAY